jgi:hypothetical protein
METLSWSDILLTFISMVLTVISGVLVPMLVTWLKAKIKDETVAKYVGRIGEIIIDAVIMTNQKFVDAMKKAGTFDAAAQQAAFEMTKAEVLKLINDEAKKVIVEAYGDFDTWLINKIEKTVGTVKK